jgi:hypothetical protein
VYSAEIIIIFIGISISFLFEQWREENRQKQELIELAESLLRDVKIVNGHLKSDLKGTDYWLLTLDSLRTQRDIEKIGESELLWLHSFLTGRLFGLFDSKSPAYLSAINNGQLTQLPDSIQLKIYLMYEDALPNLQYVYEQQLETAKYFRNEFMLHSNIYLYKTNSSIVSIDFKKFGQEVQRPVYGNFINQIIGAEEGVRNVNISLTEHIDSIIKTLDEYIKVLKTQ